jgi:hypothetical protein
MWVAAVVQQPGCEEQPVCITGNSNTTHLENCVASPTPCGLESVASGVLTFDNSVRFGMWFVGARNRRRTGCHVCFYEGGILMRYGTVFTCAVLGLLVVRSQVVGVEPPANADGSVIDALRQRQQVVTQAMKSDVQETLSRARVLMSTDPAGAENGLKLLLFTVEAASDLDPDVRQQLRAELRAAVRTAALRKLELDEQRRARQQSVAARAARHRAVEDQTRTEDKASALMGRLASLMDEGRYAEAEQLGGEAAILAPGSPSIAAAALTAYQAGVVEEFAAIRSQRGQAAARAYVQAEATANPFPGEPPIVYPAGEVWKGMTLRRAQYSSSDLQSRGKAEQEILKQLDAPTRMDFERTPLGEAVEYLAEVHGIDIMVDRHALNAIGLGTDTPVTIRIQGISLRSGLKLMLKSIDPTLAYTVDNEVLALTTREVVEQNQTTRNYPVADLVLPVHDARFVGAGGFNGTAADGGFGGGAFGGGGLNQQGGFGAGNQRNNDPLNNLVPGF